MYQRDYYNWKVSGLVSACHKDIVDIMKENSIEKIMFYQHEDVLGDGIPMVTFNNDKGNVSCQELGEITYQDDSNLVYISSDCKFSGYTDGYYGDYFDVAQSLPKIYAAIVDIVNANDVKPNECSNMEYEYRNVRKGKNEYVWWADIYKCDILVATACVVLPIAVSTTMVFYKDGKPDEEFSIYLGSRPSEWQQDDFFKDAVSILNSYPFIPWMPNKSGMFHTK